MEERKKGRDKEEEEEEASSNSPVGDFSSEERIYAATYPGWLLNGLSLSLSLFFSTMAVRSNVYIHAGAPAHVPLPVYREERSRCKGDPRRF